MVWLTLGAPAQVTVALPGLTTIGLEASAASVYVDRFSTTMEGPRLKVISNRDIAQVLSFERQRQLMGCAEGMSESCLVELAGALGADVILSGSVAKLEGSYVVTLRAFRATNGQVLASRTGRPETEPALLDWLDSAAVDLRGELLQAFGLASASRGFAPWVTGLLGLVAAGTGAVLTGLAYGSANAVRTDMALSSATAEARIQQGRAFEASGAVLLGVGAAGLVASALWLALVPSPSAAALSAAPTPGGGAWAGLTWSWP